MSKSRFQVGDCVRLWKPRHAEHGSYGTVEKVITIEEYANGDPYDLSRGPHAYRVSWTWRDGQSGFCATLPDYMVVGEDEWTENKGIAV